MFRSTEELVGGNTSFKHVEGSATWEGDGEKQSPAELRSSSATRSDLDIVDPQDRRGKHGQKPEITVGNMGRSTTS